MSLNNIDDLKIPAVLKGMSLASKLSELRPGDRAMVKSFDKSGGTYLRLMEMGLLPGTSVQLLRRAPLGDPLELEVRGYNLSLRSKEAEYIFVEPIE